MDDLTPDQKAELRRKLIDRAKTLSGIPYKYGAEWTDYSKLPDFLDCSECVEGVFTCEGLKMPDGSQAQFDSTVPVGEPRDGDLAFAGKEGGNPKKIYHVGIVCGDSVIEARAYDEKATFHTNMVIMRPLIRWKTWLNFAGFRSHPKLL